MPQINFIQAINQALAEEMERDPLTFLMGEDVVLSAFGATKGLIDKFGAKRVRNTPISEAGFVGAAVGAAMAGTRPICEVEFASFFYCAFDQVCNQAAKLRYMSGGQATMPITFRAVFGAMGGAAAQHSETVYAQFLSVPGLKLVVPSGPSDMKGLLKTAIRDNNPVIVFERRRDGRMRRRGRGDRRGRRGYRGGRGALWRGGVSSGIDAGAEASRGVASSCAAIGGGLTTLGESNRAETGGRTRRQSRQNKWYGTRRPDHARGCRTRLEVRRARRRRGRPHRVSRRAQSDRRADASESADERADNYYN